MCVCQEWEDLLAQEEVQLRDAQKEKVLREKREQEERERKEREKKERATEQGEIHPISQSIFHRGSGDRQCIP